MNIYCDRMKFGKKLWQWFKKFWMDESGGSMLESGLLIALSLILFLMLIGIVTNIYDWIEQQFQEVFDFFSLL